jgi:hypothetical protein
MALLLGGWLMAIGFEPVRSSPGLDGVGQGREKSKEV